MKIADVETAIEHFLKRAMVEFDGRNAKEWALGAAVLIDKLVQLRAYDVPSKE